VQLLFFNGLCGEIPHASAIKKVLQSIHTGTLLYVFRSRFDFTVILPRKKKSYK